MLEEWRKRSSCPASGCLTDDHRVISSFHSTGLGSIQRLGTQEFHLASVPLPSSEGHSRKGKIGRLNREISLLEPIAISLVPQGGHFLSEHEQWKMAGLGEALPSRDLASGKSEIGTYYVA